MLFGSRSIALRVFDQPSCYIMMGMHLLLFKDECLLYNWAFIRLVNRAEWFIHQDAMRCFRQSLLMQATVVSHTSMPGACLWPQAAQGSMGKNSLMYMAHTPACK